MFLDGVQTLDPDDPGETMLTLRVGLPGGSVRAIPAIEGLSIMELLRANEVPIVAECGGAAVCATCHVRIEARWRELLPPPSDEEQAKLDEIPDADDNSRLACQIAMTPALDGFVLDLAADSLRRQPA